MTITRIKEIQQEAERRLSYALGTSRDDAIELIEVCRLAIRYLQQQEAQVPR